MSEKYVISYINYGMASNIFKKQKKFKNHLVTKLKKKDKI